MNVNEACQILNVSMNTSKEELKTIYKQLVLKYHPDRNNGDSSKFIKIHEAYELLLPLVGIKKHTGSLNPIPTIIIDFGNFRGNTTYTPSSWSFNFG